MGRFYTTWRVATILKPFHMNTEGAFPFIPHIMQKISCDPFDTDIFHVIILIVIMMI